MIVRILVSLAAASAFSPSASTRPSSALGISSFATPKVEQSDPAVNPAQYLPKPGDIERRATNEGTILVSGLLRERMSEDQFMFDMLNGEHMGFAKIVAHCPDTSKAKKRLISRSARYTGLLDKLDFCEGEKVTMENLEGVNTWLACVDGSMDAIKEVADLAAKASSLQSIGILVENANQWSKEDHESVVAALEAATKAARDSGMEALSYTLCAFGELGDHPDGKEVYMFEQFASENGTLPVQSSFSRQDSYRVLTELLQLDSGKNQALTFSEVHSEDAIWYKLVKGLRKAGFDRPQEMDYLVREGVEAFEKEVDQWQNTTESNMYMGELWWEAPEFQKRKIEREAQEAEAKSKRETERADAVRNYAAEWIRREYFRQTVGGQLEELGGITELEFVEVVFDRAMLEGEIQYRIANGEKLDEDMEMPDFKAKQDRKQKVLLMKAKEELVDALGEDIAKFDGLLDDDKDDDEDKKE